MSEQMATRARGATGAGSEVRGRSSASFGRRDFDETKPSFMTTEHWLTLAGIAALIVTYNVAEDPSLDLFRLTLLCTLGVMAYVVSRGLAKAGAYRVQRDRDD